MESVKTVQSVHDSPNPVAKITGASPGRGLLVLEPIQNPPTIDLKAAIIQNANSKTNIAEVPSSPPKSKKIDTEAEDESKRE